MILRDRLAKSTYGRDLLGFIDGHVLYHVKDWGNDDSGDKANNRPSDREVASSMGDADVVTSMRLGSNPARHDLLIDIDRPCWLIPSTTPGHYHLYVSVKGGIDPTVYGKLLDALANANVIEVGYAGASQARGFTSVRLPWIQKVRGKVPD